MKTNFVIDIPDGLHCRGCPFLKDGYYCDMYEKPMEEVPNVGGCLKTEECIDHLKRNIVDPNEKSYFRKYMELESIK